MGSPEFALPSLKRILDSPHQIVGIVTQPDKLRGRGQRLLPTPVKKFAIENQLSPIFQPLHLKEPQFLQQLQILQADIFVVVAFRILPPEVFDMPELGTINLHPSLLPKYRGAAPIHWTIINGEKETGITIIKISREIDAGEIYLQKKVSVLPDETAGSLHDRLSIMGAELMVEALNQIGEGNISPRPQDATLATPAPKITPEMCHISFVQPAEKVKNWIHGLSPHPAAFVYYKNIRIKIYRARVVSHDYVKEEPGTIVSVSRESLEIACRPGKIEILELQREGKKRLSVEAFLRGNPLKPGERFK